MPSVATLGALVINDDEGLSRHRLGIFIFSVFTASIALQTVREKVAAVRKRWPLQATMGTSQLIQSWAALIFCIWLYVSFVRNDSMRFPENWLLANRLSVMIAGLAWLTTVYYAAQRFVFSSLDARSCKVQSANLVRIMVKLGLFLYWTPTDFFLTATIHPWKLTDEVYWSSYVVIMGIGMLYVWEVCFRELAPVNIIHHLMACIGVGCVMEWASVVEPVRTCTSIALLSSLIEGFCCMGTVAYRLLPKGRFLQRILLAETAFILVAYNLILLGQISHYIAYYDLFGDDWKMTMPCLAGFTYPAQMNMARIFYTLYKKAGKPERCGVQQDAVADTRRRGKL